MVTVVMATIAHPTKAEAEEERHAETQESCPFTSGGPTARRVKRPKKTDREQLRAGARRCFCRRSARPVAESEIEVIEVFLCLYRVF